MGIRVSFQKLLESIGVVELDTIPSDRLNNVCKYLDPPNSCRYIFFAGNFVCVKNTTLESQFDTNRPGQPVNSDGLNIDDSTAVIIIE